MVNKHMKTFGTLSAIRGLHIKATMKCHFTPTQMAIIQKTEDVAKMWRSWSFYTMLVRM